MAKPKEPLQTGEYGSDAMNRLQAVIEKQHQQTAKQTSVMICLTVVMLALTVATAVATIVQAWPGFTALPH